MPGKAVTLDQLHKNYEGKVYKSCKHCSSRVRVERKQCPGCGRDPDVEPPPKEKRAKKPKVKTRKDGSCAYCWKTRQTNLETCAVCNEPVHRRCRRAHTLAAH